MAYKCVAAPWVNRLCAVLLGVFSVLIVWSEATIGIGSNSGKTDLSPFSHVRPCSAMLHYCTCSARRLGRAELSSAFIRYQGTPRPRLQLQHSISCAGQWLTGLQSCAAGAGRAAQRVCDADHDWGAPVVHVRGSLLQPVQAGHVQLLPHGAPCNGAPQPAHELGPGTLCCCLHIAAACRMGGSLLQLCAAAFAAGTLR